MNHCDRQSNINVVNPITKLPTEQLIVRNLLERKDLIKDKAFLRCSIQDWDNITKLCDEQLGTHVLYLVAMLLAEALEEAGTANGLLCHSDGDDFTTIDLATVIPKVREN